MKNFDNIRIKKDRIWSSKGDYESIEEIKERRLLLIETIRTINDIIEEKHGPDEKPRLLELLIQLTEELKKVDASEEYLKEFVGDNGSFTEEARNNPDIMTKWVAHDLLGIINHFPISASMAQAHMNEFVKPGNFSEYFPFLKDETSGGVLRHDQVTPELADFAGKRQALLFYLRVLDAEDESINNNFSLN